MQYTSPQVYEYISKQTNDPITERKTCAISGTQFPIYQSDLDFYNKISPTFAGERFQIPTPTLCPEERQRRRLSFRNERKLYKRKCDATGKDIISMYSPDKPYKVYDSAIRWSDTWDPMEYGRDFDFSKSFTQNFKQLVDAVPKWGLITVSDVENSPYTNYTAASKNIYMCSDVYLTEDAYYCSTIKRLKYCVDCTDLEDSEYCYSCFSSHNLNHCKYVFFSKSCSYSFYLDHCFGVNNSLFCIGLTNKSYYILNEFVGKEEYERVLLINDLSDYYHKFQELILRFPKSALSNISTENCIGDNLIDSSHAILSFDSIKANHSKYISTGYDMNYCMDTTIHNIECLYDYEAICGGKLTASAFNALGWGGNKIYYSNECIDCNNCFACIGLRNKSYCIFNKQYTKEEYEIMVGKIIRHMQIPSLGLSSSPQPPSPSEKGETHWGEFFHPSLSQFGYNETVAQEYYPMEYDARCRDVLLARPQQGSELLQDGRAKSTSLQQIDYLQHGYKRSTYSSDPIIPADIQTIDFRKPERSLESDKYQIINNQLSSDTRMELTKQILICEVSGRPFRLQKAELEFYRKMNIQMPRKHPDIRHEERMGLRPGRILYLRDCDKCGKEMLSVYPIVGTYGNASDTENIGSRDERAEGVSPQQPLVYCESCYQQELYA